jgi:AcrR family transcriptional regulator
VPTAKRLLEAARGLLQQSGYHALSLEAIGREAGENKSLIGYHFGGKPGLLVALADWVLYDWLHEQQLQVKAMAPGAERQLAMWTYSREVAGDSEAQRLFFELLPHLFKYQESRRGFADLYARYRTTIAKGLSLNDGLEPSSDERTLASMLIGLTDGLALQLLADPGSVDMERVAELWQMLVRRVLGAGQARVESSNVV